MQQPDPRETRNLIIAMGLVLVIMFGWNQFRPSEPSTEPAPQEATSYKEPGKQDAGSRPHAQSTAPQIAEEATASAADNANAAAEYTSPRITISAANLRGSLSLQGARIDDMALVDYKTEVGSDTPVQLLHRANSAECYFLNTGWVKSADTTAVMPDAQTVWTLTEGTVLTPTSPIVLEWRNGSGLTFKRTYRVDDEFLVTVTEEVRNTAQQPVRLAHYAQVVRQDPPAGAGFAILHEGPIGFFDSGLKEVGYDDIGAKPTKFDSASGWIGLTDKYWLTAIIPEQNAQSTFSFRTYNNAGKTQYFCEHISQLNRIDPGASLRKTYHFYVGAKKLETLDAYESKLGIDHLDKAVDFGRFYFLTKPLFQALNYIQGFVGNFGIAILILTVLIKLLLFPVANKSYRSMARMKALKPKLDRLKEEYADDKMKFAQAQMELFKTEKVNPMAGCLPMLAQIPVFFALYKVLFISIEMRHAPFFGWIRDLSAPDPTSFINLFGLLPFEAPGFLQIGIWPIVMGLSMLLQQRLNPTPQDPVQEKMFMFMPLIFTVMLANFPAGLVIYWTWNNLLSILQQATIMKLEGKAAHS